MKVNSPIIVSFVVGAVLASLPYTLSAGKALAQGAGPNSSIGQGQGFPPQQGQGFPGQAQGQGFPGQQRPMGSVVNSMAVSGNNLFAAAGDTIYKIDVDSMQIKGQTKLPASQQFQGGQAGRQQGGNTIRGGGSVPPSK